MKDSRSPAAPVFVGMLLCCLGSSFQANAEEATIRPGMFSFLEKPMSVHVGDATFQLRGGLEQATIVDFHKSNLKAVSTADFELSAETKLRNQITVRASYSGKLRPTFDKESFQLYDQKIKGSFGGIWGTVYGGTVTDLVGVETKRRPDVGNADLAFENGYGKLKKWGGGYRGRFGPMVLSLALDEKLGGDAGVRFSRPLGDKDFGFAVRGTLGSFVSADETTEFETESVTVTVDVISGSSMFDVSLGYEHFSAGQLNAVRLFGSLGMQHKVGVVTLSAHGHIGRVANQEELSFALGGQYDIARGLSANLGFNYSDAVADVGSVNLVSKQSWETVMSLRYEF